MEQNERERRLVQAQKVSQQTSTQAANPTNKKAIDKNKRRVLGNLSVIVGPNRRGDIVVREGDDLPTLVRNFIALYGLKKSVYSTVLDHLT